MRKTTEDIILEELFNLSHKVDRIQETMATKEELKALEEKMATKEELKALEEKMATKEELKALEEKMATKEDIKNFVTNTQLKKEFDKQAEEIAQIFHNTFATMGKREKESEQRIFSKLRADLERYANS